MDTLQATPGAAQALTRLRSTPNGYVQESLSEPRLTSATARRHGISRQLLLNWRKAWREGRLGEEVTATSFVPAVVTPEREATGERRVPQDDRIEIMTARDIRNNRTSNKRLFDNAGLEILRELAPPPSSRNHLEPAHRCNLRLKRMVKRNHPAKAAGVLIA